MKKLLYKIFLELFYGSFEDETDKWFKNKLVKHGDCIFAEIKDDSKYIVVLPQDLDPDEFLEAWTDYLGKTHSNVLAVQGDVKLYEVK